MNRSLFLRNSFKIGALVLLDPAGKLYAASTSRPNKNLPAGDEFMKRLFIANDQQAKMLLASDLDAARFSRKLGQDFAVLSASYASPESKYYRSASVLAALEKLSMLLLRAQTQDGTVNIGNLESPPDTAFLLESVTAGAFLLNKDQTEASSGIREKIKSFIVKAAAALTNGGVHTPNHRWVVSAALARAQALYPNPEYLGRIEEWLDEGVFIDDDGHFPERSQTYSVVENEALITMFRLLNKPLLLHPVRKNLEMTYYYMEPNGELVTTDSRRQDQYVSKHIVSYYLHYRYMAIHDSNSNFAAIARLIENMKPFNEELLHRFLYHFLENPLLQQELPKGIGTPVNFEKIFTTSHLLRIRRSNTSMTLFGGVDWPLIIASGRANSANFFSYRKGSAVLQHMRISTNFFGMGYFYGEGLQKVGKKYVLDKKLEVPYYQPLAKNKRNLRGDYKLSPSTDGRFWNKMDFENRPVSNVKTLQTTVALEEANGTAAITINITGQESVAVTIELCFREGGKLSGVSRCENGNHFLEKGTGTYRHENDSIQFGPGCVTHRIVKDLEGERYSTHFGSLRREGMHVYLTGVTPFSHKLVFG